MLCYRAARSTSRKDTGRVPRPPSPSRRRGGRRRVRSGRLPLVPRGGSLDRLRSLDRHYARLGQTSRRTGSGRPRSRAAGVLLRPRSGGPRRSRGHGGRSPTWRANPASGGAGQGARVGRLHRHRGLGALAGVLAVGFSRGLYLTEDVWDRLRAWEWAKPAFGGLVLGSLGILSFQVDGLSTVLSSDSISLRRGNEQHVVRGAPCYATATSSPLSSARIRCPTLEDCSSAESPGWYRKPPSATAILATFQARPLPSEQTLSRSRAGPV